MDESEDHLKLLTSNRFKIVQHLQVERSFLFDYLLSKNVFDRDDYDMVRAEKTRERKAVKVLDIIETKGPDGFNHFKDALQLINPNLYEIITGEKATVRDSPILEGTDFLDSGEGLPRLIDQDILSNHLKRVTDDLRDMTLRYNTLLKDDQQLRKALKQSTLEKTKLLSRLKVLEVLLAETEVIVSKTHSDANVTLLNQYQEMQEDRHVRKDFIIQLQMKLLQSQEKYEDKTRQLEELTMKCKHLEEELLKVNENYFFQRSQTKKLSVTLQTRTEEAKYCDNLQKQCREKQFKIMELQGNLDDCEKELDEIKNWTTALKQRYDSLLREKNEVMAKQHEATESLSFSKSSVTDMEIKLKRLNREMMDLKKERDKLEGETGMLKGQLKAEHTAHIKATEKNEELKVYFNELIEAKEVELNNNKEYTEYLQEELEDLKRELCMSKKELSTALNMNDSLTCDIGKLKTQHNKAMESLEKQISENSRTEDTINGEEKLENVSQDVNDAEKKISEENKTKDKTETHRRIRRVSTAELLESIRRRFRSGSSQSSVPQGNAKQLNKSRSLDGPSCPQRSSTLRTLPYEALSSMYTSDTGAGLPNSSLLYARKTSSPFPLSSCTASSVAYLQSITLEGQQEEHSLDDDSEDLDCKDKVYSKEECQNAAFRPRSHVVRQNSEILSSKLKRFLKK